MEAKKGRTLGLGRRAAELVSNETLRPHAGPQGAPQRARRLDGLRSAALARHRSAGKAMQTQWKAFYEVLGKYQGRQDGTSMEADGRLC